MNISNKQHCVTKYKMEIAEIDAKLPQLAKAYTHMDANSDDAEAYAVANALRSAYVLFLDEIRTFE